MTTAKTEPKMITTSSPDGDKLTVPDMSEAWGEHVARGGSAPGSWSAATAAESALRMHPCVASVDIWVRRDASPVVQLVRVGRRAPRTPIAYQVLGAARIVS